MGTIISSGTSTITSGEILYYPTITNSGRVVISSGGKVSGAIIENGGMEVVSSGGIDYGAAISSGGAMMVMMKGSASDTVVSSASVQVYGGIVCNASVGRGASLIAQGFSSGAGTAIGYIQGVSVVSSGNLVLNMNAVGSAVKVLSGYAFVSSGGLLQESLVSGGSSSSISEIIIDKGGSGYLNSVYENGVMGIRSGGKAAMTKVYSHGEVYVSNGGLLSGGTIFGVGWGEVHSGGTVSGVTVASGGFLKVSSGGVCIDPVFTGGGAYLSGGKMSGADLQSGHIYVYTGGSTRSCFIGSEGGLVLSGGSSIDDTVLGGVMLLEKSSETGSMGYAENLTVEAGRCKVSSGGSVHGGTVSSGGSLYVDSGGNIDGVNVRSGGQLIISFGGYHSGGGIFGIERVYSGGSADKLNALSGGYLCIEDGGRASGGSIYSGGTAVVKTGAHYYNISAGSDAKLEVFGTATVTSAGALDVEVFGTLTIYKGAACSGFVGGRMILTPGDGFSGTSAVRAAYMNVMNGGTLEVGSYCSALSAYVYQSSSFEKPAGLLLISSGGFASGCHVHGDMTVRAGGSVTTTSICSAGHATVSGFMGQCTVSDGASVHISSGGTAYQTTVGSGGFLAIAYGGKCDIATIASSGTIAVSSGATATNIYINNGYGRVESYGILSGCSVNSGGSMSLYGTGSNVTITSGGSIKLWADGLVDTVTIQNGGTLDLASRTNLKGVSILNGGRVTVGGPVTLSSGALSFQGSAGILDFNISYVGLSSAGNALVREFDAIAGAPLYSLTVSDTQRKDTYVLASNASKFGSSAISVRNSSGTALGTLSLDNRTRIGDKNYTLDLSEDNVLSVSVAAAEISSAKADIDGNCVSDVLFQYTGGDYQLGYWMNGTNEWRGQGLAKPAEWEVLGSYDMNSNGKADCVLVGNVTTEIGGKGAYIGYYLDSVDKDSNWQNIGYLNNEEDIAWKNKVGNLTGNAGKNSIVWYAPELFALGVWTDGTTEWVNLSASFGGDYWTLIGCGDFDGNGKDSVVMSYNKGQFFYAIEIGGTPVALGSADWRGWELRAIGDFAGDGRDDIVLFHEETGSMVLCADGNLDGYVSIGQLAADDWFVVGAGDYNGDAKDDLLVRQKSTGMLGYYVCADTSQWVELGRGVDTNWTVIA